MARSQEKLRVPGLLAVAEEEEVHAVRKGREKMNGWREKEKYYTGRQPNNLGGTGDLSNDRLAEKIR
jgi:hypothetical protein